MSVIPALQSEGMTIEQGLICVCNRCKHRWLPEPGSKGLPKRCAKCKNRAWNRELRRAGRPRKAKPGQRKPKSRRRK